MSQIQELKPCYFATGCVMRIFIDHSKAPDSLKRQWTEVTYDGMPGSEVIAVPSHWHKDHDEKMTVLEGEVDITLDGVTTRVRPGDKPFDVPRYHVHSVNCLPGIKTTVKEATNPNGDFKEWFFRDLFDYGFPSSFMYTMRSFYDGDCYAAMPWKSRMLDQLFINIVGGIAKLIVSEKKPLESLRGDLPAMNDVTTQG